VVWHENQKGRLGADLLEELKPQSEILEGLETIHGITSLSDANLLAETGPEMTVFGTSDRLSRQGGICPGNSESAGKRKSGRPVTGNRWMRRTLCECAHASAKITCHFSRTFRCIRA
jgi:hypothetical protein